MKNKDLKNILILYTFIIFTCWIIGLKVENNKELKRQIQERIELKKEIIETKKLALEVIKQDKEYITLLQQTRESLNDEIDSLNRELKEYKALDKLKKDLSQHTQQR